MRGRRRTCLAYEQADFPASSTWGITRCPARTRVGQLSCGCKGKRGDFGVEGNTYQLGDRRVGGDQENWH